MRAVEIAEIILAGFTKHYRIFQSITAKAPIAFGNRDWQSIQSISSMRIAQYDARVNETIELLKTKQRIQPLNECLWRTVKEAFQERLVFHPQAELAETFYNSVFCRLFHRRYFNNEFIFVVSSMKQTSTVPVEAEYRSYFPVTDGLKPTIRNIINHFGFGAPFTDLDGDIRKLVKAFIKQAPDTHHQRHQMRFDILHSPFYRNKAAYIVGRVVSLSGIQPFIIAILNTEERGIHIDALITQSSQMRVIFGFARAYFFVQTHAPSALVGFLNQLMPSKTAAELYNAIGFHKQGKTEFYREFLNQLESNVEQFIPAPGTRGMVMMVFTLPSFPYVFKVIRDQFSESKPFGRETVLARYQLVKNHDRVGRMADTIEYSNVVFPLARFSDELLNELQSSIAGSMVIENDLLIIKHLYIERRMTPLNLFLQTCSDEDAKGVMADYGQALKEMVSANIFPGDMLLKNFGVTKHQRVIFYDYDEVQYLTEMNFREMPRQSAENYLECSEVSSAPQDVFPEQLCTFVLPDPKLRALFLEAHPDLAGVAFWKQAQTDIRQKVMKHIYPYPQEQRFCS
ncbi:bifunctional isocitrate dehydrogenase kinase/phosphatase [Pseudoalteromonas xiamenensis]|uniref:bifunctional isocitrate dehydrogenase kinase/phosphatase n=1 Tax=Pseudoalteromonas xiamenensis TaxID=882626 RepID=UPI0035EA6BE1